MLVGLLSRIERQPLLDVAIKEVLAINTPRIAIARSRNERMDVAVNELGDTFGLLGLGFLADKTLQRVFKRYAKSIKPQEKILHDLSRSLTLYSIIFAFMWAMPYIRNYVTAKHTGSANFAEIIGETPYPQRESRQKELLGQKLNHYRKMITKILTLGGLGAVMSTGIGLLALKKNFRAGAGLKWLHSKIALEGGSFWKFSGLPAVLFWAFPAYAAWIQAARDGYERKEWMLKFVNFVVCFMGPQKLMEKGFRSRFRAYLPEGVKPTFDNIRQRLRGETLRKALRLKTLQEGLGLLFSLVLMGITPGLMNIALTRKRIAQDQETPETQDTQANPAVVPELARAAEVSAQDARFQAFVLQAQSRYNAFAVLP